MGVDLAFLEEHASYEEAGVREQAFYLASGDGWCFGILYTGTRPSDVGFVISHSVGLELTSLHRVERGVARGLAQLGYPVMSIHRRGYGDSIHAPDEVGLDGQLEDLGNAVARLSEETDVRRVGLIGARFGGLLAGLAARRGGIEPLILINPVLQGKAYLKQLVQEMNVVRLAAGGGASPRSVDDVLSLMRRDGLVEVLGYPLPRSLFEPLLEEDLSVDMGEFDGDALVVHATRRSSPPRDLQALRARIEGQGGTCRIELVQEPAGTRFGQIPFVSVDRANVRVDVQIPLTEMVAERITSWMRTA